MVRVEKMERIVAHSGLMKLEECELGGVYKLMRAGTIDSYLGHVTEVEVRDLFDVLGDLITYLDTAQPEPMLDRGPFISERTGLVFPSP